MMKRNTEHVQSFFLNELGTTGSVDGNERLLIKGACLRCTARTSCGSTHVIGLGYFAVCICIFDLPTDVMTPRAPH